MIKAGVGYSVERNPQEAVKEAYRNAVGSGDIDNPTQVFLYVTVGYNLQLILDLTREITNRAPLIGCSVEGIVTNEISVEGSHAILIGLIESDELVFKNSAAYGLKGNSFDAGKTIGEEAKSFINDDTLGLLMMPDGLTINFDDFSRGFTNTVSTNRFIPIFGGLASDNWAHAQTYQFLNDQIISDGVVCSLMSGPFRMAFSVNHGCIPVGKELKVTKSENNIIREIDHKPAIDVMKDYFNIYEDGSWEKATVNLTIALKAQGEIKNLDDYVVRYMPRKNIDEGSFAIATSIEEGTSVWIARRDYEKMRKGVCLMGEHLNAQLRNKTPLFSFHFDCAGRGNVIFQEEEKNALIRTLHQKVNNKIPWMGFHCYGEIGPVGEENWFHNFTAVIATLYKKV